MDAHASLSELPRFPLSIVLAYLQQSDDDGDALAPAPPHNRSALALLLATQRGARAILPLFRLPHRLCRTHRHETEDGRRVAVLEKYRFLVLRIQDPRTLLDRLNTRRLRKRMTWAKHASNEGRHLAQCPERVEADRGTKSTDSERAPCYQHGRTTEELAFEEWAMMKIHRSGGTAGDDDDGTVRSDERRKAWPAHLELLQFADSRWKFQAPLEARHTNADRNKRGAPSPFSLLPAGRTRRHGDRGNTVATRDTSARHEALLLASYPRSGNTFLRTLLERVTSTVTGSDTRPDRTLSRSLAVEHDLVGEGLVGRHSLRPHTYDPDEPLVRTVKTHFPERRGWRPVTGSRVILLVRNPYDAIDSYWNLCCTNTHTRSLDESVYAKHADKFEGLARHEIKVWLDFHYHWLDACAREGVPLLIVRYEDLVLDTAAEMRRVVRFLHGRRGADGSAEEEEGAATSFWEWRVGHALGTASADEEGAAETASTSDLGSYRPRGGGAEGGLLRIGKTVRRRRYSEGALRHMHAAAASLAAARQPASDPTLLQRFGYDIYAQRFPEDFERHPPTLTSRVGSGRGKGTVTINATPEIREKDDPYGRAMTYWRRGETEGDAKPFPVVSR